MTHSFSERPTLNCPVCEQIFTPEIWLIIDATERPDLLARVRAGTIHHVVCPNGHGGDVDAPLLIYRPGEEPALLFSPAQQTTAEQDDEIARGLLGRLAEGLGAEWREERLESLAVIPRAALPAVLDGVEPVAALAEALQASVPPGVAAAMQEIAAVLQAEGVVLESPEGLQRALAARPTLRERLEAAMREAGQTDDEPEDAAERDPAALDPLLVALEQFVRADTWLKSFTFVRAHPKLLTEAADAALAEAHERARAAGDDAAARHLADHLTLLRRARAVGVVAAFAEKLETTAEALEAAAVDTSLARQALEEVAADLRAEGVSVNSPEELQAALIGRPELAARLAEALGQGNPLLAALQQLIDAPDWIASYRCLITHPELLSDEADALLTQLIKGARAADDAAAKVLVEHQALLRHSREVGADVAYVAKLSAPSNGLQVGAEAADDLPVEARQALAEAVISLAAEGLIVNSPEDILAALTTRPSLAANLAEALGDGLVVPSDLQVVVDRANDAEARYLATVEPAALTEAVTAWEHVLSDAAFPTTPKQFQGMALNDAGTIYLRRYWADGRAPDLERAVALFQAVVAQTSPDAPERAGYLSNVGTALRARYGQTGQAEDLDAAMHAFDEALRHTPPDSPALAGRMTDVGTGWLDRHAWTGRTEDLDTAIAAFQEAVDLTPSDSPERALLLSNLGSGLIERYARTGRIEDLDAAIAVCQGAIDSTPPSSPNLAGLLNNYGHALHGRYLWNGRPDDLEAAVRAYSDAVNRTPAESPSQATHLNNLGHGLLDRYARLGQSADLDAAIDALARALNLASERSTVRAGIASNLGSGLRARFERTGRSDDLDAAIRAHEEAIRLATPGSPIVGRHLNNLGNGLRDRYAQSRQQADLDAAIAAWEKAVAATPEGSSDRTRHLNNLAAGLQHRYARTGRGEDLDRAIVVWEEAVAGTPPDASEGIAFQYNLGVGLHVRYERLGDPADLDAAIAAWQDAIAALDRALLDSPVAFVLGQQERWAGLYAQTVDALAAAGRAADALAAAEGSKSRLLAGLVGRGELPAPPQIPAALVEREQALAGQLNALDTADLAGRRAGAAGDDGGQGLRAVARRAAVVAELRAAWDEMAAAGLAAEEYVAARRGDRLSTDGLAALAGALGPAAALLSLFTTGGRTLLWLWPAGAGAPLLLETDLDPDALLYDYLTSYEDEVLNRATHRALGRPLTHRWRALGRVLLGPLRPHLAGIEHLVIAPQVFYHQLPLHALWLSEAGDTLIDHCAVSYVPALSLLERLRRREQRPAAPGAVFGYTPAGTATARERREREVFLGEAEDVARLLGVAPRLDGDATGAALEAATTGPLRLLHLSCHGYFNRGDALESGVGLADSVYTARRFMARPLPVDLVTLSACETGISGSLGGDEMAGFSMALLSAGARSLLLGLWSVEARTTARLLVDFYGRLWPTAGGPTAGGDKAQALRQTMLALGDGRLIPPQPGFDPSDPYYWAPFALIGDWR